MFVSRWTVVLLVHHVKIEDKFKCDLSKLWTATVRGSSVHAQGALKQCIEVTSRAEVSSTRDVCCVRFVRNAWAPRDETQ